MDNGILIIVGTNTLKITIANVLPGEAIISFCEVSPSIVTITKKNINNTNPAPIIHAPFIFFLIALMIFLIISIRINKLSTLATFEVHGACKRTNNIMSGMKPRTIQLIFGNFG